MAQINEQVVDMAGELRNILASIKGAQRVEENLVLQYIVVVADDEGRDNAEKVAGTLVEQAQLQNLDLEITVATEEDIKEAQERLMAAKGEEDGN